LTCISNKHNLYSIGWDDDEEELRLQAESDKEYNEKMKQLRPEWKNIYHTAKQTLPKDFFPSRKERDELANLIFSSSSADAKEEDLLADFYIELIDEICSKGEQLLSPKLLNLMKYPIEARKQIETIQKNLICVKKSQQKTQAKFLKIILDAEEKEKAIHEKTFPIRTKSMVDTMQGLGNFKTKHKIENAKAVLIAGNRHVDDSSINDYCDNNPNYELALFHDEIKKHRAVILPMPEAVKAAYQKQMQ